LSYLVVVLYRIVWLCPCPFPCLVLSGSVWSWFFLTGLSMSFSLPCLPCLCLVFVLSYLLIDLSFVLSCLVLSCLVLSCLVFVLSCPYDIISCLVLCLVIIFSKLVDIFPLSCPLIMLKLYFLYLVLSCLVLSCLVLSCRAISCRVSHLLVLSLQATLRRQCCGCYCGSSICLVSCSASEYWNWRGNLSCLVIILSCEFLVL
jgi:hypothetical protein